MGRKMKYDMHVHTARSACAALKPATILKILKRRGFSGVAVTDHETIKGAIDVSKLNKDKNFEVIIGSEVKTDKGDVLCYYLNEEIKSRELFSVIDEVKSQDGVISVAHPYRVVPWTRFHYSLDKLLGKIDAIEVFNSRTLPFVNYAALKQAQRLNIPGLGGSDSHFSFDLGNAYTVFEGDLRKAIKRNKTSAGGSIAIGWLSGLFGAFHKRVTKVFS